MGERGKSPSTRLGVRGLALGGVIALFLAQAAGAHTVSNGAIAYELRVPAETCDQCGDDLGSEGVGGQSRIHLIQPDGSHRRRLPCSSEPLSSCQDSGPAFDRTGRRLAVRGEQGLLISRPLGSRLLRLRQPSGYSWSWSPDGRSLALLGSEKGADGKARSGILISDLRGNSRLVQTVENPTNLSWSARRRLAWDDGGVDEFEPGDVWVAASETATPKRVARKAFRPRWSYSGRRLAFYCRTGLCVSRADGSRRRTLSKSCERQPADEGSGPGYAWAPDGSAIACQSKRGSLILVRVKSGRVRLLRRASDLDGAVVGDIDWQPRLGR